MRILKASAPAELFVKNSRFLSEILPAGSPEEARAVWHAQKERYQASHAVYAFITGPQGNVMSCSDDGEPSGTAGRPTLEVLKGACMTNVILTTIRWFGGTLLGTGGLVRAYTASAQAAVEQAVTAELVPMTAFSFDVTYALYEQVRRLLTEYGITETQEEFGVLIHISAKAESCRIPLLEERLRDLSNGRITFAKK